MKRCGLQVNFAKLLDLADATSLAFRRKLELALSLLKWLHKSPCAASHSHCRLYRLLNDQSGVGALERHHFPPPWTVREQSACFVMQDHSGRALAYIYYQKEPGRGSAAKLLTKDEARRFADNFAKLPDLLRIP
jgi:hypothetical protein